ncbi:MAG TPA: hypothetical protein VFR18_00145 [Terriglobia bacterium]|nr:hypothetical protein [Terriglobia bacterium]
MAKRAARRASDATPGVKSLDRMVGTWRVSGEAHGTVRYEWFDRKSALIQYVNLGGTKGFEVIRFDQDSQSWRSWFFDRSGSAVLEYTYEVDAEQLKISIDMKDRHGSFVARFSDGGNVLEGRWDWTQAGKKMGYNAKLTRVRKVVRRRSGKNPRKG